VLLKLDAGYSKVWSYEFGAPKVDAFVKSRHTGENRGPEPRPGVVNYMILLDSGFRRNDDKSHSLTFYETIKVKIGTNSNFNV